LETKTLSVECRWDIEVPVSLVEAFLDNSDGSYEEVWNTIGNWLGVDVPVFKGVKISFDSISVDLQED